MFWVPKDARWKHLQDNGKQPTIGKLVDEAMIGRFRFETDTLYFRTRAEMGEIHFSAEKYREALRRLTQG